MGANDASDSRRGRHRGDSDHGSGPQLHDTAKDLAGKRIAVNTLKNIGDTTVRQSVRQAGGNPAHIRFEPMPFAAMPGAVQSGQVDARCGSR